MRVTAAHRRALAGVGYYVYPYGTDHGRGPVGAWAWSLMRGVGHVSHCERFGVDYPSESLAWCGAALDAAMADEWAKVEEALR